MNRFTIIHLSDLHFDDSKAFKDIWDKLIDDIKEVKRDAGIELFSNLVITGDIVDRGRVELYDKASELIKKLRLANKIGKKDVLIIPGNHDVNAKDSSLAAVKERSDSEEIISKDWPKYFSEFCDFSEKTGDSKKNFFVTTKKVDDLNIRYICFNTAWSTMLDKDFQELKIGENQLKKLEKELETEASKKKADFTIAMMHHPIDWFAYEDRERVHKFLKDSGVNVLLHGHIHDSFAEEITDVDSYLTVLCTGWSYRRGETKKLTKDSMLRYSIYDFDFNTKTINVYCRVTTRDQKKFTGDHFLYSCADENGFFSLPLGNPAESIFPIYSAPVTKGKRLDKPQFFLNKSFFKTFLNTEEKVFMLHQRMEDVIDDFCSEKELSKWTNRDGKGKSLTEYVDYSLGSLCETLLLEVPSMFGFDEKEKIRMMFRIYDAKSNSHVYLDSYGEDDNPTKHKVKDFVWKEGMIYKSFEQKKPLLKSANKAFHKQGNTDKWTDYLTMTIDTVLFSKREIPMYSLNFAIASPEWYGLLLDLSLSSFHYSLNQMFGRCRDRVKMYVEEQTKGNK